MSEPGEVFQNAPLKSVAYEVRFPSLFYIPQAVGEFQKEIMDDFPKASQLATTELTIKDGIPELPAENSKKTTTSWQFESETGKTKVMVTLDRLLITSEEYHSYDHHSGPKFRDAIDKTVTAFIQEVPIKKFTRIGLMYTDHCPLAERTNQYFTKYYVPIFNIDRYKIDDLLESQVIIRTKKTKHNINFLSRIIKVEGEDKYVMAFDAYAENVDSANFLFVTD